MKKVVITGILGQDGANMAEYLLSSTEHEVIGVMRRSANPNYRNIESIKNHPRFKLSFMELTDTASIDNLVKNEQPDYFINFAANSFVGISWDMPESVFDTNAMGVLRCLEAIRKFQPKCRFYSAGSSEELGNVDYSPQDIHHPIKPRSPYGASKAAARHLVKVYRESYGLYAVHGILFNHEGPKRGEEFVTRKITMGVARIYNELKNNQPITPIELGNLDAKRDWSDSRDFVRGVWLMLNQPRMTKTDGVEHMWGTLCGDATHILYPEKCKPKDYVLASGKAHSIREFVEMAFSKVGMYGKWINTGNAPTDEIFITSSAEFPVWGLSSYKKPLVVINPKFYRPAEVDLLMGDSTPIREELGWEPKISLDQMVKDMVESDLNGYRTQA